MTLAVTFGHRISLGALINMKRSSSRSWVFRFPVIVASIFPMRLALVAFLTASLRNTRSGAVDVDLSIDEAPCVRLFHSSGDVGCRTAHRDGVIGALLGVRTISDLHQVERLADDAEDLGLGNDQLVVAMPMELLNSTTIEKLSATERLAGVLVVDCDHDKAGKNRRTDLSTPSETAHNHAVTTPQGASTPTANFAVDASYPWNPRGDGLLMQSLAFPVALVSERDRGEVCSRVSSNGKLGGDSWRYPLHKAKMTYYFGGSRKDLNSQACLGWLNINGDRAPQCLPIGGQSTWASAGPPGAGDKETVFAVTGMDATSMFHDLAPGANAAASGLVALLAAADAIGEAGRSGAVDLKALPRQMVFAAFQAEAYGFTGSRRFVKDLLEGVDCENRLDAAESPTGMEACLDPLYPSLSFAELGKPAHVVSVDQVGYLPNSTLWVHSSTQASARHRGMISKMSPVGTDISVANSTRGELPPTPLTSFVKAVTPLSGFVIAGYDDAFASPYYHSTMDTRDTVDASSVAAAATLLAKSTLLFAGGSESSAQALQVNETLVGALLDCVVEDWTCDTFLEYVRGEVLNIEETLGFRVRVDAPVPPTLYRGPLEFRFGGGLPTVRHTSKDGSWRLHPKWTEPFDSDRDKIQMVPNILEMFCRAFLSEQLGSGYAGGHGGDECRSSGDCSTSECPAGLWERGSSTVAGPVECVRGRCACVSGFHHIALDVGLEREEKMNTYKVLMSNRELEQQGIGLWTEVFWHSIGVQVFQDPGVAAGRIAMGLGAVFTLGAGFGSWRMMHSLMKLKLL